MGTEGSCPEAKRPGCTVTTHLQLVPTSEYIRALTCLRGAVFNQLRTGTTLPPYHILTFLIIITRHPLLLDIQQLYWGSIKTFPEQMGYAPKFNYESMHYRR